MSIRGRRIGLLTLPGVAVLALALASASSAAAPRTLTLKPGDEIRIAGYDWRCVSVDTRGDTAITCWPLDSTKGPLVYLSTLQSIRIGSSAAPKLWGYEKSPRSYTYALAFGHSTKLPFNVGETEDLVLQRGDTLLFSGFPSWTCQSTIRTPNFSCAQRGKNSALVDPILSVEGRALYVGTERLPVLESLIGGSHLYSWP